MSLAWLKRPAGLAEGLLLAASAATGAEKLQVFILSGQSNMVGHASSYLLANLMDSPRAEDAALAKLMIANYDRDQMISTGIPGRQSDYPDADWPERAKIWREWIDHVKIMHKITGSTKRLPTGWYPDTGDIPHFLYVRLARRMIGEHVMSQHDLMLQTDVENPIGLGYYMVDIYPCRLIATADGKVASEGETSILISPGPYQIPYESIVPKKQKCDNLLVPVCMSASHVALASIRMEPTYMIMGEAAGIAAARSLDEKAAVQEIDQKGYRKALLEAGMVLEWDGTGFETEKVYGKPPYWVTNPDEYSRKPYASLYKGGRQNPNADG